MSLVHAIEDAIRKKRRWIHWDQFFVSPPSDFEELLDKLPHALRRMDRYLWNGQLFASMQRQNIPFRVRAATKGPAGATTFDTIGGICMFLNKDAWVSAFPAMVGGTLCSTADTCLAKIVAHETIHMLLFVLYAEANLTWDQIRHIPSRVDTHHNVLFCRWLRMFFDQFTVDNSLLVHVKEGELLFTKDVNEIEKQCLRPHKSLQVLNQGQWESATFLQPAHKEHHSILKLRRDSRKKQNIVVPNGLIRC